MDSLAPDGVRLVDGDIQRFKSALQLARDNLDLKHLRFEGRRLGQSSEQTASSYSIFAYSMDGTITEAAHVLLHLRTMPTPPAQKHSISPVPELDALLLESLMAMGESSVDEGHKSPSYISPPLAVADLNSLREYIPSATYTLWQHNQVDYLYRSGSSYEKRPGEHTQEGKSYKSQPLPGNQDWEERRRRLYRLIHESVCRTSRFDVSTVTASSLSMMWMSGLQWRHRVQGHREGRGMLHLMVRGRLKLVRLVEDTLTSTFPCNDGSID